MVPSSRKPSSWDFTLRFGSLIDGGADRTFVPPELANAHSVGASPPGALRPRFFSFGSRSSRALAARAPVFTAPCAPPVGSDAGSLGPSRRCRGANQLQRRPSQRSPPLRTARRQRSARRRRRRHRRHRRPWPLLSRRHAPHPRHRRRRRLPPLQGPPSPARCNPPAAACTACGICGGVCVSNPGTYTDPTHLTHPAHLTPPHPHAFYAPRILHLTRPTSYTSILPLQVAAAVGVDLEHWVGTIIETLLSAVIVAAAWYVRHPTSCILHPTPYILISTSDILYRTPYIRHRTSYNVHPHPTSSRCSYTLNGCPLPLPRPTLTLSYPYPVLPSPSPTFTPPTLTPSFYRYLQMVVAAVHSVLITNLRTPHADTHQLSSPHPILPPTSYIVRVRT